MRRIAPLLVLALALGALLAPAAGADPVQQYSVQVKDVKPDGRYTLVYQSNSFDTSGDAPPAITSSILRFPKGLTFRPAFLKRSRLCDIGALKTLLVANQTSSLTYKKMLDDLPRTRKAIGGDLSGAQRRVLDTCAAAKIGGGTVKVDVRPVFGDLIPAFLWLFLTPPSEPGAVVGFGIMSVTDQRAAVVRDNDIIAQQKPNFTLNVFDDPTADGTFGYRLVLPATVVNLVQISIAELRVTIPGLTDTTRKRTCAKKAGGRCAKYKVRTTNTFWAAPPTCPSSGTLSFLSDVTYETGQQITTPSSIACPRFR